MGMNHGVDPTILLDKRTTGVSYPAQTNAGDNGTHLWGAATARSCATIAHVTSFHYNAYETFTSRTALTLCAHCAPRRQTAQRSRVRTEEKECFRSFSRVLALRLRVFIQRLRARQSRADRPFDDTMQRFRSHKGRISGRCTGGGSTAACSSTFELVKNIPAAV